MNILWLKTELLHPIDKGGKIRTYNMLRELKTEHHVTYLTLDNGLSSASAVHKAAEYCHDLISIPHRENEKFSRAFYSELALNLLSPLPYAIKKYSSAAMRADIESQIKQKRFDVLVCDFLAPAINVASNLPVPTVLFQHNVEAMIWKRHYEVQSNPLKKAYLYSQWRKMRWFENKACQAFDCVIAVSAEDRLQMKEEYGLSRVYDVPTGVDTGYFQPQRQQQPEANHLVFTGSMDWLPNEDGILYFIKQIMPLVKQSIPDLKLTVVGRNPTASLRELADRDSSVIVTGRVDDVRPYIENAAAYIVPLRIGGGTRLKIYEAMAMERPVISTTIGAEGLPVRHGAELMIADSVESFANAVIEVLTDETLASRLGRQAAQTVRENFSWNKVARSFANICERAIAGRSEAHSLSAVSAGNVHTVID